ncbi:MAG: hypothetical protein IK094_05175, partial [Treponema sp.]|nr:hypothetical protein [Treponema sp.]
EGVSQEEIDSTFNAIDFDNREIKRFHEPFSLVLMRRALRSWNYGSAPGNSLFVRDAFDRLKKKILADPNYIKRLVKEYLIDNKSVAWTVVVPDKKYLKDRAEAEKKIALELFKDKGKEEILRETKDLRQFQQSSEKDLSCLPHIRPKDLKVIDEKMKVSRLQIKTRKGSVPLFKSLENTNGIAYVTAAFPLDIFAPEEYPYLPFFAYILNELGWGDLRWDKASILIAKTCGGFSTSAFVSSCPKSAGARLLAKTNKAFAGRPWLFCKIKALDEKIFESVDLMRDCLMGARYDDKKRVKTLAEEVLSDLESSVLPNGHSFASGRAERKADRASAIDEIWSGVCQIFAMRKIVSDLDGTIEKMKAIAKKVFAAGAVLHVTADKDTMPKALAAVKKFAVDMDLRSPQKKFAASDQAFYALTDLKGGSSPKGKAQAGGARACEKISVNGMVGFAALSFKASKYATREAAAEKVLAHLLSSGALWEKIRAVGGAYGAFAHVDSLSERWTMCTYRDPNPEASLKAFDQCLEEAAKNAFDAETVEKAVAGTYSSAIQPKTPKLRGYTAFLRQLYLVSQKEVMANTKTLLSIKPKDLQEAARRLLKARKKAASSALIVPKGSPASRGSIEI